MKSSKSTPRPIKSTKVRQQAEKFDINVYTSLLDDMREVYKYCQIDSIQQTVLQQKLGLLLQNIQMSNITRLPLIGCIYNAVSAKVNCIVNSIYNDYGMKNCDVPNNFFSFFYNPTNYEAEQWQKSIPELKQQNADNINDTNDAENSESESDNNKPLTKQQETKFIRNMGGFVHLDESGYHDYITGVDISSSYPAAKESNNIDKNSLITAEDFADILLNPEDYGIESIKVIQLYDMYSPYIEEHLKNEYDDIDLAGCVDEVRYDLSYGKGDCKRTYRYLIEVLQNLKLQNNFSQIIDSETHTTKKYIFGQYFYYKTNQDVKYPFVFLRQTPDYSIKPEAPKAQMLLDFRVRRQQAKKNLKAATDPFQRDFFNAQQQAIKILINSEYGANDSQFCTAYNMFESSLVTKQARYAIQNCRDTFTSKMLYVPENLNLQLIDDYNQFLQETCNNPDLMKLSIITGKSKSDGKVIKVLKNIDVHLVYTDTDSSYVTLPQLNQLSIKPQYENIAVYIRSTVQGKYNIFYQDYIKKIMHKRSLEFGFEGAFYKSWHITNKNYLGQKIDCITTKLVDDTANPTKQIIVPACHIEEQINFDDFDVTDDTLVSKYLESKHIKITGLKIIKRNTIKLAVIFYLKAIAAVLNTHVQVLPTSCCNSCILPIKLIETNTTDAGDDVVEKLLKELRDNFDSYPLLTLMEKKKVTVKFKQTEQGEQFNLGESVYFYYQQPENLCPNRYYLRTGQKKSDLVVYLTQRQPSPEQLKVLPEPFRAQYIFNIASNLYKFFNNSLSEKQIKDKLRANQIIQIGAPKAGKVKQLLPRTIVARIEQMLAEELSEKEFDGYSFSLIKLVGELDTRKNTGVSEAQIKRYKQLMQQLEEKKCRQLQQSLQSQQTEQTE